MDIEALRKLMDELTITKFKTANLIPYVGNARTHSDEQVLRLVGSIRQYGFVNPILVGEDRVIIAGHCRLMAAQRLGLENIPVIVLPHLTEDERHALVIADNKLAEDAGWNDYTLSLEIQKLRANDFPLESLGIPDKELKRLLNFNADEAKGLTDDDAAPEVAEDLR
jgi:ParB-like chromosome segregation protein Spo0J